MPLRFEPIDGKTVENTLDRYKIGHKFGFVKVVTENGDYQVFPKTVEKWAQSVIDFEIREDDIFLCSFPKAGTTWGQEMVWMIGQDCDTEGAKEVLITRFPYMEYGPMFLNSIRMSADDTVYQNDDDSIQLVNQMESPRYIKCHMTSPLLPSQIAEKKPKIIYIIRHPKDNCVSFYYFSKLFEGYTGTFDEFCESFMEGNLFCGPYWSHVLGYWKRRNEPNVLVLTYEDMKKDLRSVLTKVADFMDKKLTEDQYEFLLDHLSFAKMKVNPYVNYEPILDKLKSLRANSPEAVPEGIRFMRKGETGDWKNHMSAEVAKKFDEWIETNTKGTGLSF